MSACLGLACTPSNCRYPSPECKAEITRLELCLWSQPDSSNPLGLEYWIAKAAGDPLSVGVAEEGPAEEFEEPKIVHTL